MKKVVLIISIFILTSSLSFYLGYKFQKKNGEIINETAEYKHKIDIEEEKCLDKAKTTSDTLNCVENAALAWENEIQNNLKNLERVMSESEFKYIEEMNEKWQEAYKSQIKVIVKFIYDRDGTMYQQIGSNSMEELNKQYALFLHFIYSIYIEI